MWLAGGGGSGELLRSDDGVTDFFYRLIMQHTDMAVENFLGDYPGQVTSP